MSRRCRTPRKHKHETKAAAVAHIIAIKRSPGWDGQPLKPYRCACQSWHVAHVRRQWKVTA